MADELGVVVLEKRLEYSLDLKEGFDDARLTYH